MEVTVNLVDSEYLPPEPNYPILDVLIEINSNNLPSFRAIILGN